MINNRKDSTHRKPDERLDRINYDAELEELAERLRAERARIHEAARKIPGLTAEQIHEIIGTKRLSQYQLRKRMDNRLMIASTLLTATMAYILWRTTPNGLSVASIFAAFIGLVSAIIALRAAYSLWLMKQTERLMAYPYRMARYTDRLNKLSNHRRPWINYVISLNTRKKTDKYNWENRYITGVAPWSAVAACAIAFIIVTNDQTPTPQRNYSYIETTSQHSNIEIYNIAYNALYAHE